MTDTTRDLIQRLVDIADALDGRKPLVFSQGQAMDGFTALANFQALANEARAFLSQPEPEGLTDEEIEKSFQLWWFNEGSGMRPSNGEDQEEHVRRVSQIAWSNGAHVARWGCPAVEPPAKPAHNTAQDSSQRP